MQRSGSYAGAVLSGLSCLDSNNSTGTCASKAVDKNGRALTGGQDRPLWRRGRVMTASSDPSLTLEELIQVCDQIDVECDCPVMIGPDKIDYSNARETLFSIGHSQLGHSHKVHCTAERGARNQFLKASAR
jgi:hypothetical protein